MNKSKKVEKIDKIKEGITDITINGKKASLASEEAVVVLAEKINQIIDYLNDK